MNTAQGIKQRLLARIRGVCEHLLPRGYFDGTNWRVGSVRGESGSSLSVSCAGQFVGFWKDFAESDDHQGDIFKLWMMVRGISFAEVLEEAEFWLERGAPPMPAPQAPEDPWRGETTPYVPATMPMDVAVEWEKGRSFLGANPEIRSVLDQWRAWPRGTTEALTAQGLVACPDINGKPHWAFPVQYPTAAGCITIGYHARPVDQTPGRKSPWMYRPNARMDRIAIPAVPFVLGGGELKEADLIVVLEGQWDAVMWAATAGWLHQWPRGVTVFGLRGATSWRVFLAHWGDLWPATTRFLLIPDGDDAGQHWRGQFASTLIRRGHVVRIVSPPPGLDFSDWHAREPFSPARVSHLLSDQQLYQG